MTISDIPNNVDYGALALLTLQRGYVWKGKSLHEQVDPEGGQHIAELNLARPKGIQQGLAQPAPLALNEVTEVLAVVGEAGYWSFTTVDAFRTYESRQILAEASVMS